MQAMTRRWIAKRSKSAARQRTQALVATVCARHGIRQAGPRVCDSFSATGIGGRLLSASRKSRRAVDRAYGILLSGSEDDDIQGYFIESAFPAPDTMISILDAVGASDGLSINELLARVTSRVRWPTER